MNTPVSFPTAKLLKEKGFDEPVHQYHQFTRELSSKQDKTWQLINSSFLVRESDAALFPDEGKNGIEVSAYSDRIYRDYNFQTSEDFISAPTIAEVVMWLYEKHGIWIFPDRTNKWFWTIQKPNNEYIHQEDLPLTEKSIYNGFNSPTEAYEAAITYVLTNLIP